MDEVEWLHVAGCARDDDRALDRRGHQHRQLLGAGGLDAVGDESPGDQIGPAGEHRRGTFDQRRRAGRIVGVAGLDRDGDDRAAGPVVTAPQLFAVSVDERVEQFDTSRALGISLRDVIPRVIDCLAEQLSTAVGKIVIRRPARCTAVLEHVGNRGRLRSAFADQQGGGVAPCVPGDC